MAKDFEDRLLALEVRVLEQSAGDFLRAVDALRAMLTNGTGGIERKLAALAIPDLEAKIAAGIGDAYVMGAEWALGAVADADVSKQRIDDAAEATRKGAPKALIAPSSGLQQRLRQAKATAGRLLRNGTPVQAALVPIFEAATSVRATVTTQVNAAANTASEQVGAAADLPMVWEAERDACVHCLALAGEVVQPGKAFPLVSYGIVPKSFGTISKPPRHPNCRCRLAVLADQAYADALRREAQRSVLRGFSLPSERPAVRVEAAKRLLADGVMAPKSVKAYARDAIKNGKFPTRAVPAGDPRLRVRTSKAPGT